MASTPDKFHCSSDATTPICHSRRESASLAYQTSAENFSANTFTASLAAGHNTLRGRHDRDTESTLHAANLFAAKIYPASRTRDALQVADNSLIVRAVLQVHADHLLPILFRQACSSRCNPLPSECGRSLPSTSRQGTSSFLVAGTDGVADAGKEVCYWVGQVHQFSFIPRSLTRAFCESTRKNQRKCCCLLRPDFCTLKLHPKKQRNEVSGVLRNLRSRVKRYLPAGLHNTRNLTLEGERTEAETADAELAQESARATADLAAVVLAGLELRNSCVFDALCCSCHNSLSILLETCEFRRTSYAVRNGIPKAFSSVRAPLSSLAVVTMVTFMPFNLSTFA